MPHSCRQWFGLRFREAAIYFQYITLIIYDNVKVFDRDLELKIPN